MLVWLTSQLGSIETDEDEIGLDASVARLNWLLNWIPARITALFYSLVGSFGDSLRAWQRGVHEEDGESTNNELLLRVGGAAIGYTPSQGLSTNGDSMIERAHLLIRRTLIAWVSLSAVLTLTGVLG